MAGTVNIADIYGTPSAATGGADQVAVKGPNPGAVASSGQTGGSAGSGPAFAWVGFVLALVLLRVLIEMRGTRG